MDLKTNSEWIRLKNIETRYNRLIKVAAGASRREGVNSQCKWNDEKAKAQMNQITGEGDNLQCMEGLVATIKG